MRVAHTIWLRFGLLPALLSIAAFAPLQQGGEAEARITQVDTSRFPVVNVYVSVTDAQGEPVAVDPVTIRLFEDGQAVELDEARGLGEDEPLSTLLVMDVSGSMNLISKLQSAQLAAQAYVDQMRPGDRAGILAFNTQVSLVQPLTADRDRLGRAIASLEAFDDTALYDAVAEAVALLQAADGRKAILVLSDGMDNSSRTTLESALTGIGPGGLSISTVGLGDPFRGDGAWAGLDVAALRTLADVAGGTYTGVDDATALQALYERLGRALQSELVLTYVSPSRLRDGVNRSLTVLLSDEMPFGPTALYNPGGLVPEVSQPAPWPVFFGALTGLGLLFVGPRLTSSLVGRLRQSRSGVSAEEGSGARIRLREAKEPRIRLH